MASSEFLPPLHEYASPRLIQVGLGKLENFANNKKVPEKMSPPKEPMLSPLVLQTLPTAARRRRPAAGLSPEAKAKRERQDKSYGIKRKSGEEVRFEWEDAFIRQAGCDNRMLSVIKNIPDKKKREEKLIAEGLLPTPDLDQATKIVFEKLNVFTDENYFEKNVDKPGSPLNKYMKDCSQEGIKKLEGYANHPRSQD